MACHRRSEAATGGPAARSALPGRASRSDQADDPGERPHQPDVPLSPRVVDRHLQDVQDGLLEEVGIEDGHSHCGGDRGGREPAWCGLALSRGEIGVSRSTRSRWARARAAASLPSSRVSSSNARHACPYVLVAATQSFLRQASRTALGDAVQEDLGLRPVPRSRSRQSAGGPLPRRRRDA
jgi:hypothetical protein